MSSAIAGTPATVAALPLESPVPIVHLSHSASTLMEKCGKAYEYRYKHRLESQVSSVNLGFGLAFDKAITAFVVADAYGTAIDAREMFTREFSTWASLCEVDYSSKWAGKQAVLEGGDLLVQRFVDWWRTSGYSLMIDTNGLPIVQRKLRVRFPDNVVYTAILDLMVLNRDLEVTILDLKTPASDCSEVFARNAGQLTGQQIVVEAHKAELGIERVERLGFLNAVKRPKPQRKHAEGPIVVEPKLVPARTEEEIQSYVQSQLWVADDIRRGRFGKRSLNAYDSPCGMCDMRLLCSNKDPTGIRVRQRRAHS